MLQQYIKNKNMDELQNLLHELRCDINYCKVSFENDTEIRNAEETLKKIENLVNNLTPPDVNDSCCPFCKSNMWVI